jgi:CPA2 family monovalent cation:H+ antiporter-2
MPQTGRDLLLAGAILSILVNPLLFIAIGRWQARQDRKAAELPPEQAPVEDVPPAIEEHDHAILIGYGRVGRKIALRLREAGTPLVVIEDSRAGLDELRESGISAVLGNAARPEVLELAQLARARWLLLAIPNGFEAGQIAQQARAVNPRLTIIARAHFDAEVEHLEQNGADLVIMGEREIARAMIDRVAADQATPDAPVAA